MTNETMTVSGASMAQRLAKAILGLVAASAAEGGEHGLDAIARALIAVAAHCPGCGGWGVEDKMAQEQGLPTGDCQVCAEARAALVDAGYDLTAIRNILADDLLGGGSPILVPEDDGLDF